MSQHKGTIIFSVKIDLEHIQARVSVSGYVAVVKVDFIALTFTFYRDRRRTEENLSLLGTLGEITVKKRMKALMNWLTFY